MDFPYAETVIVSRPGGFDRHGDPLPTTEHPVECVLFPTSTDESAAGNTVDADWTLLGDYGADLQATDTVYRQADTTRAEPLSVSGVLWNVRHPMTGWEPGCQAYLKYRAGGL